MLSKALKYKLAAVGVTAAGYVGTAAAALPTVNWTELGDFVGGVADIFPGILDLVVAILPVVICLAVVGMVSGLFDKIVSGIKI